MKKKASFLSLLPINIMIVAVVMMAVVVASRVVMVLTVNAPVTDRTTFVIDAGHGIPDGGATSCTGKLESVYNLEIALKLNDLMHLLGMDTKMVRENESSIYTSGETIAEKKVSDLKERVRMVNETENAVLISIHQNQFQDSRYSGAQVFYAPTNGSQQLAEEMQSAFVRLLNPDNHRQIKKADGIYLMQNIRCTGILVECGFLSNPEEEALLRSDDYQKKLCVIIACTCSTMLTKDTYT